MLRKYSSCASLSTPRVNGVCCGYGARVKGVSRLGGVEVRKSVSQVSGVERRCQVSGAECLIWRDRDAESR
eukprot:1176790-Rhodomonas_salina.1